MNPPDSPDIPLQQLRPYRYYSRVRVSSDHARDAQVLLPKRRTRPSSIPTSLSSNVPSQLKWVSAVAPWSAILVAALALQAVLVIVLGSYIAAAFCDARTGMDCRTGPAAVLLGITSVEAVYLLLLAVYAVRGRNLVLILGLCANAAAMLGFVVLERVGVAKLAGVGASAALSAVVGVGVLVAWGVAWKVGGEFEWDICQNIPMADVKSRREHLIYASYIALLHLNLFLLLPNWTHLLTTSGSASPSQIIGILGLTLTPFHLALAGISAKREVLPGQIAALVLFAVEIGMLGYEIRRMSGGAVGGLETAWLVLVMGVLGATVEVGGFGIWGRGGGLGGRLGGAASSRGGYGRLGRYGLARRRSGEVDNVG
ncbi:hypothetical protein EJ03DRAFT_205931 [Teratosphaeria nubilosa]|uniref:Uncharacterized protein n=1 Tax=Teratosphaeria nubilosa TaxID=161662 RepID=A0A6G1KYA1_9PEZI|nr:hypothetical protein EJ03DRAFT_205931 [Teratosphaeria nubilosa]